VVTSGVPAQVAPVTPVDRMRRRQDDRAVRPPSAEEPALRTTWRSSTAVAAVLLSGVLAVGTSCSRSPAEPAAGEQAGVLVVGELLQFRRDVPARRLQIRLTATAPGLVVEGLELAAPGLPAAPAEPRSVELHPQQALDLPVIAAPSDCATAPGPPEAVVRLRDGAGDVSEVTIPLEDGGLVRRLHGADCADQALRAQADVAVSEVRATEAEGRPALRVTVRLTRLSGDDDVRVTDIGSNTVYAIRPAGPLPTLTAAGPVDLELFMTPARCDTHALGESYRTGLIGLVLALGDAEPQPFVLTPPNDVRRELETFAVETCRSTAD
jgi:hypothetical protein